MAQFLFLVVNVLHTGFSRDRVACAFDLLIILHSSFCKIKYNLYVLFSFKGFYLHHKPAMKSLYYTHTLRKFLSIYSTIRQSSDSVGDG